MKAKKLMALILASAMTFSLALTGCGGDGGNSGESSTNDGNSSGGSADGATEVTFWTLNTRQNAVDPIAEAFNSSQDDVHVTVSYYDTDGIKDACKVAASSKTLPNMWFNWGGSLGGFYAENGLTYDLTQ